MQQMQQKEQIKKRKENMYQICLLMHTKWDKFGLDMPKVTKILSGLL